MKKTTAVVLSAIFIALSFGACAKSADKVEPAETLPVNDFPATKEVVENALKDSGLEWVVSAEEDMGEGRVNFTVADKDGKVTAFVLTGAKDDRRLLDISTTVTVNKENKKYRPVYEDEWERVIKFGTLLYGGFENINTVFELFDKEYPETNTEEVTTTKIDGGVQTKGENIIRLWKGEVDGIYVTVRTNQPDSTKEEYFLYPVRFDNTDYQ